MKIQHPRVSQSRSKQIGHPCQMKGSGSEPKSNLISHYYALPAAAFRLTPFSEQSDVHSLNVQQRQRRIQRNKRKSNNALEKSVVVGSSTRRLGNGVKNFMEFIQLIILIRAITVRELPGGEHAENILFVILNKSRAYFKAQWNFKAYSNIVICTKMWINRTHTFSTAA